MTKIDKLEKIIKEQEQTILHLQKQVNSYLEKYNGCRACAESEDSQMCYDCFYGPNHD